MFVIDSLLGLLALIGLAYWLDSWVDSLREVNFQTYRGLPYLEGSILANLTISIAILALAWHVLFRKKRNPILGMIFLFIGLGITLLPIILLRVPASISLFSEPEFRILRISFLYSRSLSRLQIVGASVTIFGLLSLVDPGANRLRSYWERIWQIDMTDRPG